MKAVKIIIIGLFSAMGVHAQTVTPNPGPYQNISTKYQYTWQKWSGGIWNLGKLVQQDSAYFGGIVYVPTALQSDSNTRAANTGWVREWVRANISGGGGGSTINKWDTAGNAGLTDPRIGTTDASPFAWVTGNIKRLVMRADGIVDGTGSTYKFLVRDAANGELKSVDGVQPSDTAAMLAGYVRRVHAGTNITIDNTDPRNPVVNGVSGATTDSLIITPNSFAGLGLNDVQKIQRALDSSISQHKKLYIPFNTERGSKFWMIDSAILLRSNADITIINAVLKLTDSSRDNIFRTANCGVGITNPESNPISNITIVGVGEATLEGADNPRSTGDYLKPLKLNPANGSGDTYGSDAAIPSRRQFGDWRNYAAIMAYTTNAKFKGIKLKNVHAYGVSFHRCSFVNVEDIVGEMYGYTIVGGVKKNVLNHGMIDFNMSMQNIYVNNIKGISTDDNVALNIVPGSGTAGSLDTYYVGGDTYNSATDSIYNVSINNIGADSYTSNVRVLCSGTAKARFVYVNNVFQNRVALAIAPQTITSTGANILIGSSNPIYGGSSPLGNISNFFINKLGTKNFPYNVYIAGSLSDSYITDVRRDTTISNPPIYATPASNGMSNVGMFNAGAAGVLNTTNLTGGSAPAFEIRNTFPGLNNQSRIHLTAITDAGTGISRGTALFHNASSNRSGWANYEAGRLTFWTGTVVGTVSEQWRVAPNGNFSNNGADGTAWLHLKAGTATASTAPIKLTSGVQLTTPEAGALETDGVQLKYSTSTTAASRGYVEVRRYVATATSITADANHSTIDVTATGQTITLPTAVGILGRTYTIKLTGAGTGTVATTSSQTIDGGTTYSLSAQYKYVTVQSTNANWIIIAAN